MIEAQESEDGMSWSAMADSYEANVVQITKVAADRVVGLAGRLQSFDAKSNVLDIGAGTGIVTATVVESQPSCRVLAIDISTGMLNEIKRRNLPNVSTKMLDQRNLHSLGPERFTHIFSTFSIQFIKDPIQVLNGAYHCLKSGGIFGLGVWGTRSDVMDIWIKAAQSIDPSYTVGPLFQDPHAWRTTEELKSVFKEAGFVDLAYETIETPFAWRTSEEVVEFWFNGNHPIISRFVNRFNGDMGEAKKKMLKISKDEFEDGANLMVSTAVCVGRKA